MLRTARAMEVSKIQATQVGERTVDNPDTGAVNMINKKLILGKLQMSRLCGNHGIKYLVTSQEVSAHLNVAKAVEQQVTYGGDRCPAYGKSSNDCHKQPFQPSLHGKKRANHSDTSNSQDHAVRLMGTASWGILCL